MIQQINLYQKTLKSSSKQSAINHYLYGFLTAIILLIGFSIYLFIDLNNNKNHLQRIKLQLSQSEAQIKNLQTQYPKQQLDPLLTQETTRLQRITTGLNDVVALLTDKNSDQTQGFSRYFSALARQSISEVWLSHISINGKQHSLKIQGSTFIPEKIPLFLQKLHNEPVFQGRHFAKLILSKANKSAPENQIDFTLGTTLKIVEQEHHD